MTQSDQPATREERLAAKLRENLRRRKAQSKAMDEGAAPDGSKPLPKDGYDS